LKVPVPEKETTPPGMCRLPEPVTAPEKVAEPVAYRSPVKVAPANVTVPVAVAEAPELMLKEVIVVAEPWRLALTPVTATVARVDDDAMTANADVDANVRVPDTVAAALPPMVVVAPAPMAMVLPAVTERDPVTFKAPETARVEPAAKLREPLWLMVPLVVKLAPVLTAVLDVTAMVVPAEATTLLEPETDREATEPAPELALNTREEPLWRVTWPL